MRYRTIAGEFHIHYPDIPRQGPQPDGDTITFKPDAPGSVWSLTRFGNHGPDFNGRGNLGVRFEGIDALETHFQRTHQAPQLAYRARDFMLAHLGFKDIEFWEDLPDVVERVGNNPRRGYILANGVDGNGRILAFVYVGEPPASNGEDAFLDEATMLQSANLALIQAGLAYAAIYTSLPLDLAAVLRTEIRVIREQEKGIFEQESFDTQRAAGISNLDELQVMVIWPKLFRRLASFFSSGHTDLGQFIGWLRDDETHRDDRLLLPSGELGNMHDLVVIGNSAMRLRWNPEEVTILPDNA